MKLPMHILVIEGWPTLLAGGQERSLFEVVSGLRKLGITFTLAYEQEGDLVPKYRALVNRMFTIPSRSLLLKSLTAPQSLWNFFVSVCLIIKHHITGQHKWNLIYVNQYFDLPLAALCGMILKIPVVCHLRLAAPHYLSRQYRWGLNRCRLLVCNSHFTASTYQQAGISAVKMVVAHNAIDTEEFCPPSWAESNNLAQRQTRQILYLGRIANTKGIETLIDGVALARKTDGRLRLLVVGNIRGDHAATGEYRQQLHNFAVEKLGNAVEFRSATPDVVGLYRHADLVVLPSVWEESFGRVIIEAMACGVPCLASRVGGIPEILNEEFKELLFERNNSEELASLILHHVDWRQKNPDLGKRVREKIVKDFASKVMHAKFFSILQGIGK